MKKILSAVLVTLFVFNWCASAQDVFIKGDKIVNAGIGLGTYLTPLHYSNSLLPVAASFEYCALSLLNDMAGIGVGGYMAYTSFTHRNHNDWNVRNLVLGVRGGFHYHFVEKLDTYAGLLLGYNIVSRSHSNPDTSLGGGKGVAAIFVGGRYYLTQNIALNAELSVEGVTPLTIGVSFKFE
jgi:hypothetical protein